MPKLALDFETFSSVPIGDCGAFKYIESPDFRILLLGYAYDDGPVQCVDLAAGEKIPCRVAADLYDPGIIKTAWNAAFERECLHSYFCRLCPPEQWEDTMILAAQCGLPLKLADAGEALGLSAEKAKMKEGSDLIRYFCIPCKPTKTNGGRTSNRPSDAPDKWETFKAYNRRDVEVERTIRKMLERWAPTSREHDIWCLDQRINGAGMRIDPVLVANAIRIGEDYKAGLLEEAMLLTGMDNPNSTAQVKAWLQEQEGVEVVSLNKKVVANVVAQLTTDEAKRFMDLRKEFSKSSAKKYNAMLRSAGTDDHVRGCFQFCGANRTGRWAGRLVQLQNIPQNHLPDLAIARELVRRNDEEGLLLLYPDVASTLSELLRTALIPEDGHRFIVADYSAIEARVIAWIAGERWRLGVFENGGDIYCASASQMFHVPVEKHGQNAQLRQKGKIAELALGYGGGVNALKAFGADHMGMSDEEMVETVDLWRASSPHICALWRSLEKSAIRAVVKKTTVVSTLGSISFSYESGVLWMVLPSGRRIAYWGAEYSDSRWNDRKCLTYMGQDQTTKKWTRLETWGGKLTENLVQATARDCLRDSMLALANEGYDIRAHVHDECIITEPIGGRSVDDVCAVMGRPLAWAPGLPLRADGYETPFYMKD